MPPKRLPAYLPALALSAIAAAPPKQLTLFPWWEELLILLLVILLVAVLIIWNARQPLEYVDSFSHGHGESHQTGAVPAPTRLGADDLEIIEGIGPKIKSIFAQAGIATFAQLADSNPAELESVLRQAGLRLGDPTTWPEQARLAEDGDWDGLQRLQDSLKAGRRR